MKKKITAVLLLAAMLMQTFVGCSQATSGEDTDSQTADAAEAGDEAEEEAEVNYLETLGEKDFGGADYTIIDCGGFNVSTELTGDAVNDAMYNRDLEVMEKYNVKIQYPEYGDSGKTAGAIIDSVKAGDCIGNLYLDALSNGNAYMTKAFRQEALYNMLDLPYLDLSADWWSTLAYDNLQLDGKMYFTAGYITPVFYKDIACTFMNLAVAEDHGINASDVYQLVYDGKWTVDEMMKLTDGLTYDVNGDGKILSTDDSFGVLNDRITLSAEEFAVGFGMKMSTVDDTGNLVIDLVTDRNTQIIEKIKQCFMENAGEDADIDLVSPFVEGRTLFIVHFTETAPLLRDMEDDFTILPMPKYDTAQDTYYGFMNPHGHAFVAVPRVIDDAEKTGFITEALGYVSYESVVPAVTETLLKGKVARDEECKNMLDIVFASAYLDLNSVLNIGGTVAVLGMATFNDKDFVSLYKKNSKITATELETILSLYEDPAEG